METSDWPFKGFPHAQYSSWRAGAKHPHQLWGPGDKETCPLPQVLSGYSLVHNRMYVCIEAGECVCAYVGAWVQMSVHD